MSDQAVIEGLRLNWDRWKRLKRTKPYYAFYEIVEEDQEAGARCYNLPNKLV